LLNTIHCFNAAGLKYFESFLKDTKLDENRGLAKKDLPSSLISDPMYVEEYSYDEIDITKKFTTRYELGKYLVDEWVNFNKKDYDEVGVWAWIAAVYFDQIRGKKTQDWYHFIPGEYDQERTVQSVGYRHAVRTPFKLIENQYEDNFVKLCTNRNISTAGDAWENFTGNQKVLSSAAIRNLLVEMYYDEKKETFKPGVFTNVSKAKHKSVAGKAGARRVLPIIIPRVKKSFDIHDMDTDELIEACGKEVQTSRWVKKPKIK